MTGSMVHRGDPVVGRVRLVHPQFTAGSPHFQIPTMIIATEGPLGEDRPVPPKKRGTGASTRWSPRPPGGDMAAMPHDPATVHQRGHTCHRLTHAPVRWQAWSGLRQADRAEIAGAHGKTVPTDRARPQGAVLRDQPSLYSAAVGHHFARPAIASGPLARRRLHRARPSPSRIRPCSARTGSPTSWIGRPPAADELSPRQLVEGGRRLAEKSKSIDRRPSPCGSHRLPDGLRTKAGRPRPPDATIGEARLWVLPTRAGECPLSARGPRRPTGNCDWPSMHRG